MSTLADNSIPSFSVIKKRLKVSLVLFLLINITSQAILTVDLAFAEYIPLDVKYYGSQGSYSLLHAKVLVVNTKSLPIYVPGLVLELSKNGERGIEIIVDKISVAGHSAGVISLVIKIYHTEASKNILKTLLETGDISADIKVYAPVALLGAYVFAHVPIEIPEGLLKAIANALSIELSISQYLPKGISPGVAVIAAPLALSLQQGTLNIASIETLPETEDHADVLVKLTGTLPEDFRSLGDIRYHSVIADVIFDEFGHLFSIIINSTTIRTSAGSFELPVILRIYKNNPHFADFIKSMLEGSPIPSGTIEFKADISLFDIELEDCKFSLDLSALQEIATAATTSASGGLRTQQVDTDLMGKFMDQIFGLLMLKITSMFSLESIQYTGSWSADGARIHGVSANVKIINNFGWTFGLRDVSVKVLRGESSVIELDIPGSCVIEPYKLASVMINARIYESEALMSLVRDIMYAGILQAEVKLTGDICLLGHWIENLSLTLPLSVNISQMLGIPVSAAASLGYVHSIMTQRETISVAQDNFGGLFTAVLPKYVRIGGFNIYEEGSMLKILVETLFAAPAMPIAIENLHADVYYRGKRIATLDVPSIDLRPEGYLSSILNPIVKRKITVTLGISEDTPETVDLLASLINNGFSVLRDAQIIGSFDLVVFDIAIRGIPINVPGRALAGFLGSSSLTTSSIETCDEGIPELILMPFPIRLINVIPKEIFLYMFQLEDIVTAPAEIVDGTPVYTLGFVIRVTNPTAVTISLSSFDADIYRKIDGKTMKVAEMFLKNPISVLPGGVDRFEIVLKLYANEGLQKTLYELLKNNTLQASVNGTLSLAIGKFHISDIQLARRILVGLPRGVLVSLISGAIATVQRYLTLQEIVNMIFPAREAEISTSSLSAQKNEDELFSILNNMTALIGNPEVEEFRFSTMEYDNNVTVRVYAKIADLKFPIDMLLNEARINLFYAKYEGVPLIEVHLVEDKVVEGGKEKHIIHLTLVLNKDSGALPDFLKDLFARKDMTFTMDINSTFTILGFTFDNITLGGITVTLPPFFPEKLYLNIGELPREYQRVLRRLLGLPEIATYSGAQIIAEASVGIMASSASLMLEDLEYVGSEELFGLETHHIRMNYTTYNLLNISLGIDPSTIKIYKLGSSVPSIIINVTSYGELGPEKQASIAVDVYLLKSPETEELLNEVLGERFLNVSIESHLNFEIFGVKIDDWTMSTFVLADLNSTLNYLLYQIALGPVSSGSLKTSSVGAEGAASIPVGDDLLNNLIHLKITGIGLRETNTTGEVSISAEATSQKLTFIFDNITVLVRLSGYQNWAGVLTLTTPLAVVKGSNATRFSAKLVVFKNESDQLETLAKRILSFGTLTMDLSIKVDLDLFGMKVHIPLDIRSLSMNISWLFGYRSLEEAVYDMLMPEEETSSVQAAATSSGILEFDIAAIMSMVPLLDSIQVLNITYDSGMLGGEVYSWIVISTLNFTNPLPITIDISHARTSIEKNGKDLIVVEIPEVRILPRNFSVFYAFLTVYKYQETYELLTSFLRGQIYESNITVNFKVSLFGIQLPQINLTIPLAAILKPIFGWSEVSSGTSSLEAQSVKTASSNPNDLAQVLPILKRFIAPLIVTSRLALESIRFKEFYDKFIANLTFEFTGCKLPAKLWDLQLDIFYSGAKVLHISMEPFDLRQGYAESMLSLVIYKGEQTNELVDRLLHYGNATISAKANITLGLFDVDNWLFSLSVDVENFNLTIGSVLSSAVQAAASDAFSDIPLPCISSRIKITYTITDAFRIMDVKYVGSRLVQLGDNYYQVHELNITVQLTNIFNVSLGWEGARLVVKKARTPVIEIVPENLTLLPPGASENITLRVLIYDTPETKELLDEMLSGYIDVEVSLEAFRFTIIGITVSDVSVTFPISERVFQVAGIRAQEESNSLSLIDFLKSSIVFEIGDLMSVINVLPPLSVFTDRMKIESIDADLYETEDSSTIVINGTLEVKNLPIPVSGNIKADIFYPSGTFAPALTIEVGTLEQEPNYDVTIVMKVIIYKAATPLTSELFEKLMRNEPVICDISIDSVLWLFGRRTLNAASYLYVRKSVRINGFVLPTHLPSEVPNSIPFSNVPAGNAITIKKCIIDASNPKELLGSSNPVFLVVGLMGFLTEKLIEKGKLSIGKIAFEPLDESSTVFYGKMGVMLKLPVTLTIKDAKVYLHSSLDPTSLWLALELSERADFRPGVWSPVYFTATIYKNVYLNETLNRLLREGNFTAYIDLVLSLNLGGLEINDIRIGNFKLSVVFPIQKVIKDFVSQLIGFSASSKSESSGIQASAVQFNGGEESPPVPGMPDTLFKVNIAYDPLTILRRLPIVLLCGYGNEVPGGTYFGIEQVTLNGADLTGQFWKNYVRDKIESNEVKEYYFFGVPRYQYIINLTTLSGDPAVFDLIAQDGTVITAGATYYTFSPTTAGIYTIKVRTSGSSQYELEYYRIDAKGYDNPNQYSWLLMAAVIKLIPGIPNIAIRNFKANLYYKGYDYTIESDGTIKREDRIVFEPLATVYVPEIVQTRDEYHTAYVYVMLWRDGFEDSIAAALQGSEATFVATNISFDLEIFGATLRGINIPGAVEYRTSFNIYDLILKQAPIPTKVSASGTVSAASIRSASFSLDSLQKLLSGEAIELPTKEFRYGPFGAYIDGFSVKTNVDKVKGELFNVVEIELDGTYLLKLWLSLGKRYDLVKAKVRRDVLQSILNKVWVALSLSLSFSVGYQLPVYINYLKVNDIWVDDDPIFGIVIKSGNKLTIKFNDAGCVRLFGSLGCPTMTSVLPSIPEDVFRIRMARAPSSIGNAVWLGGGGGKLTLELNETVSALLNYAKSVGMLYRESSLQNILLDYLYPDPKESDKMSYNTSLPVYVGDLLTEVRKIKRYTQLAGSAMFYGGILALASAGICFAAGFGWLGGAILEAAGILSGTLLAGLSFAPFLAQYLHPSVKPPSNWLIGGLLSLTHGALAGLVGFAIGGSIGAFVGLTLVATYTGYCLMQLADQMDCVVETAATPAILEVLEFLNEVLGKPVDDPRELLVGIDLDKELSNLNITLPLIRGCPDAWSVFIRRARLEFVLFWWVFDLNIPLFYEISGDLNYWIRMGYLLGMENLDLNTQQPDPNEYWLCLSTWPPEYHSDRVASNYVPYSDGAYDF